MNDLSKIKHVVLDMDGTIYRGSEVFPFTLPFLTQLQNQGIGYTFLTNNSSKSVDDYLAHLQRLKIPAQRDQIYTSGLATIDYLKTHHPQFRRLFLLGTSSLQREFEGQGFELVEENPDVVVVGFDTTLTFERLCRAAWWIERGKFFVATHPDRFCPTDLPTVLVDCGAICAALTHATGVAPQVIPGKPNALMLEGIMAHHQLAPHEVMMVGDRLSTDIVLAHNAQTQSTLVLTGDNQREDVQKLNIHPDYVLESIEELGVLLTRS